VTGRSDLTIVLDHLTADCGVRIRYSRLLDRCRRLGIGVSVVADAGPESVGQKALPWLTLKIEDEIEDEQKKVDIRRRPFLPISVDGQEHGTVDARKICELHGVSANRAAMLDAWRVSREWVSPTTTRLSSFLLEQRPRQMLIATQSFLGFAFTQLEVGPTPVAFHTDYAAFYALRIAQGNEQLFCALRDAINQRIAREFGSKTSIGFVSSRDTMSALISSMPSIETFYEFPGGVDINLFKPNATVRRNARFRVLFVGRLNWEKGIKLLQQAALSLPRVEWSVIGDGPCKSMLESTMANAVFHGAISQTGVAFHMANADAFVFLGKYDTFGLSALEAMACAIPVIAVNGSGIASLVAAHRTGLTILDQPSELSQAIGLLYDSPELCRELGDNGRSLAEKMTWDNVSDNFLATIGFGSNATRTDLVAETYRGC